MTRLSFLFVEFHTFLPNRPPHSPQPGFPKTITMEDFSPTPPLVTETPSKLDPYKGIIDKWLEEYKEQRFFDDSKVLQVPREIGSVHFTIFKLIKICR
jgi:hypothetical protein